MLSEPDELDHAGAAAIEAWTECSSELRRALWRRHAPIMRALRAPLPPPPKRAREIGDDTRVSVGWQGWMPGEQSGHRIVRMTAEVFGFTVPELIARRRSRQVMLARIVAARLLRDERWKHTGERKFSLPQIARMLGRTDHSTICYSLDMFGPYRRAYPEMKARYNLLRRKVRG